jgi:hypothetical protein
LTLAGLGIAMASVFVFQKRTLLSLAILPVVVMIAMANLPIHPVGRMNSDVQTMLKTEFNSGHIGSTYAEEYMPWWISADPLSIPRAAAGPSSTTVLPDLHVQLLESRYTYRRYFIQSDSPVTLRLHQFYFPPWRVTLDGKPLATYPSTALGLLSIDVPASTGATLEVDYGATGLETLGIVLSLASALLLVGLGRSRWLLVAAALIFLLGCALWASGRLRAVPPVQNLQANLGNTVELVAARGSSTIARPGEQLDVTLTWLALRETREDLKAFVHIVDASSGRLIAQSDGNPVWGFTPTSRWRTGELVEDTRTLTIPADAPPGTYSILAGIYRAQPLQNLPVVQAQKSLPDGQVPAGTLQVMAR